MRQPSNTGKVYIGLLGLDQHEAGALTVSRLLADAGLEVVYGGRFNFPENIVTVAVDEDVDLIGLSCHSWEYMYYIEELLAALREAEHEVPIVLGGSVITSSDETTLAEQGVAATFGPSSSPEGIVSDVLRLVQASRLARIGS